MIEEKQENKKSRYSALINIGFVILIIVGFTLIVYGNRDKFDEYKEILLHLNYFNILIVLIITIAGNVLRSWRWYYLLLPIKEKLSLLNLIRLTINALAANFTMPGKMGVPVKAVLLKKTENIEISKSLPSILGEIFVEHSSEWAIAIVSIIIGGHLTKLIQTVGKIFTNQGVWSNILIGFSTLAMLIVIGWILKKKFSSIDFFDNFLESIQLTSKRPDYLGYSYAVTIFNLILAYYAFWLLVSTLGHPELDLTFIIFAGTITNFVGLISPFPGGIGIRELTIYGLYDFYFGLGGIAFLAILIMRMITYFSLFVSFIMERLISEVVSSKTKTEFIGLVKNEKKI